MNNEERMNLIYCQIGDLAEKYCVEKVVLFGSRARGTNFPKSDIDLAVYGAKDFVNFACDIDEKVDTLLKFDIVDMTTASSELREEVRRDGRIIFNAKK